MIIKLGRRPLGGSLLEADSIKIAAYIAGLAGLALLTYLVLDTGIDVLIEAAAVVGWGLIPVTLFHLGPLVFSALSWREMLPPVSRPGGLTLCWLRWIRESVNSLLPVGQVGGDLVCIRLAHRCGVPGPLAAGSMVVDLTVGVFTQMLFVLMGLALLIGYSTAPDVLAIVWTVLAGLGIFMVSVLVFFRLQKRGMFELMAKIAGRLSRSDAVAQIAGHAEAIDASVREIYADRPRFWMAMAWRMIGWIAGSGEIWLLMHFLGKPVGWTEAFILESLGSGVRAAAFLVPGAVGVLEGSYIVFGALFGVTPVDSLAMTLGKRVRELALGAPGLIAWQIAEGRQLAVSARRPQ